MKLYIELIVAASKAKLLDEKRHQMRLAFEEQLQKVGFGPNVETNISLATTGFEYKQSETIKFYHPFVHDYSLIGQALLEAWKIATRDIAGQPNIWILPRIVAVTGQIIE